jgi:hypothetical protein
MRKYANLRISPETHREMNQQRARLLLETGEAKTFDQLLREALAALQQVKESQQ